MSSTARCRCTAPPASRPTLRWPRRGRSCARCTWPTARTRSTCGPSRATNCADMTAAPDARARVLDAAVELFAQHGYDGTSVSQVITKAGVAKGGFYHHFASKESLLYEVYGDLIGRQLATLDEILSRKLSPAETLRALIQD